MLVSIDLMMYDIALGLILPTLARIKPDQSSNSAYDDIMGKAMQLSCPTFEPSTCRVSMNQLLIMLNVWD